MIEPAENGKLAHAGTGHSLIQIIKPTDFKGYNLIVAGVNGAVDSAISSFTDLLEFFVVGFDLHVNEKLNISKKSGKNHFNGCGGNTLIFDWMII
jgi:hypothetical protein